VHQAYAGVASNGVGTVISKNTITNCYFGILVQGGPSNQVLSNKVYNGSAGIVAMADAPVIKGNDIRYQYLGYETQGASPTVQLNKILGTVVGGQSTCTPCFGGTLAFNQVTDAQVAGLAALTDGPGLSMASNVVNKSGAGIVVEAYDYDTNPISGVFVSGNKVTAAGNGWSTTDFAGNRGDVLGPHCFSANGDSNLFFKNSATSCAGSGFYANSNNNTFDSNVITGALENGITIDGCNFHDSSAAPCQGTPFDGNYIAKNKVTASGGQGVAIVFGASNTFLEYNVATGSRKLPPAGTTSLDFCDSNYNGTTLLAGTNSFADPGAPVACTILH
jgi:parallel beta-helix repeat protein